MKVREERKKLIKEAVKKNDEEQDKEFKWIVDFERKVLTRVLSANPGDHSHQTFKYKCLYTSGS